MFDAYIETLAISFNLADSSIYFSLIGDYLDLAAACGEGINDFINNTAMHPAEWEHSGRRARHNALRHYRRIRTIKGV